MTYKFNTLIRDVKCFPNIPRMLHYALKRPNKAWNYIARTGSSRWIERFFESFSEYRKLMNEIDESDLIRSVNETLVRKFASISGQTSRGTPYIPGTIKTHQALNMYALIRQQRPNTLVETGVCNGFSSAIILAALKRNGIGHLYSIDYPEFADDRHYDETFWEGKGGAVVPTDEKSGWLVPDELRSGWTLILGKSRDKLAPLMADLGKIDLFLHDSEHSFKNQLYEFRIAFKYLSDSGILLASDITLSDAFDVFLKEVNREAERYFIDHNLAIVAKR